jgi:hypothetical protein
MNDLFYGINAVFSFLVLSVPIVWPFQSVPHDQGLNSKLQTILHSPHYQQFLHFNISANTAAEVVSLSKSKHLCSSLSWTTFLHDSVMVNDYTISHVIVILYVTS